MMAKGQDISKIDAAFPLDWEQRLGENLPQFTAAMEAINELGLRLFRWLMSSFERRHGVLCLSEAPANLLMWAHYADSHRGFVVEFDPASPFFCQRDSIPSAGSWPAR
jgi:hypothetical protein